MRAVTFHAVGDIRLDQVADPQLREPEDAIVRLTASAICGTDLHFVRGTVSGMKKGTVLGHEGVGVVEELGRRVRGFAVGDRVVISSTIACGACAYCRAGFYAKCDRANPNGAQAATAFFGGPEANGGFDGLQAEYARIPFAHTTMTRLPESIPDDDAILLSDIFPTGYFAADLAHVAPGRSVVVFGCGPVGQFAIASARLKNAGRIFAVDCIPSRLEMARRQGAEIVDYSQEDPVAALRELTAGIGVDRAIDAVGVDANRAHGGPAEPGRKQRAEMDREREQVAASARPHGANWHPGDAPSQVLRWAAQALAKAGTLAVIGVYPETAEHFPIGYVMSRNLTVRAGDCNHRRYLPELIRYVEAGAINPASILTQREPLTDALAAYQAFDRREDGWIKVELQPTPAASLRAA